MDSLRIDVLPGQRPGWLVIRADIVEYGEGHEPKPASQLLFHGQVLADEAHNTLSAIGQRAVALLGQEPEGT